MKTFKFMLALGLVYSMLLPCLAQKSINESYQLDGVKRLDLEMKFADSILVKSWDRNELKFEATVDFKNWLDDDAFVLESDRSSNIFYLNSEIEGLEEMGNCDLEERDEKCNCCCNYGKCMSIYITITVPNGMDLELETIGADIEMADHGGEIRLKSIGGFLDLSLSQNEKVDLDLKTIGGAMFSNLELQTDESAATLVGYKFKRGLNGGGRLIEMETIGGDIYLRKL